MFGKVRFVTHTQGREDRASIIVQVAQTPDMFNGYKPFRDDTVVVEGIAAEVLLSTAYAAGWQKAYPDNSNVVNLYPNHVLQVKLPEVK